MKISGVVIWYNPDLKCVDNIKTYIQCLDKLYIIDNSENNNEKLLEKSCSEKIEYIPNYFNYGIAKALNIGCKLALSENFTWILTMDQDSIFPTGELEKMISLVKKNIDKKIAIFSPVHKIIQPKGDKIVYYEKNRVMTSGNLLNLNIYCKIGGFLDELFIDEVDHEMCYKILKHNFKIKQFEDIKLIHFIGNTEVKYIFDKEICVYNHKPIRKYYIIRNKLYIKRLYPEYTKDYLNQIVKEFLKVILFEKEKYKKFKYMIKGIKDNRKVKEIWYDISMHGHL